MYDKIKTKGKKVKANPQGQALAKRTLPYLEDLIANFD